MPPWLEKLLTVTDTSLGLQIKLLCVPAIPSLIVMFGAYQLDSALPPGPYAGLLASVREAAFPLYWAAAFIAFIGCISAFAREYRRVHKRLFGY